MDESVKVRAVEIYRESRKWVIWDGYIFVKRASVAWSEARQKAVREYYGEYR